MTDARLPERLLMDVRVNRLPATAWRSYTHSLMWSVSNRTDGFILPDDLSMIPMFGSGDEVTLVASGLWIDQGNCWWIDRFDLDQTTKAQLESAERKRASERDRKARQRQREKEANTTPVPGVTRDVTPEVTHDFKGKDRQGQARTGQAVNGGFGEVDRFAPTSVPWDPQPASQSDPWAA